MADEDMMTVEGDLFHAHQWLSSSVLDVQILLHFGQVLA